MYSILESALIIFCNKPDLFIWCVFVSKDMVCCFGLAIILSISIFIPCICINISQTKYWTIILEKQKRSDAIVLTSAYVCFGWFGFVNVIFLLAILIYNWFIIFWKICSLKLDISMFFIIFANDSSVLSVLLGLYKLVNTLPYSSWIQKPFNSVSYI